MKFTVAPQVFEKLPGVCFGGCHGSGGASRDATITATSSNR